MKDNSGFRQTKIEKTGDHTFNIHSEDGGHFECNSTDKLSKLKQTTHLKSDSTFKGLGEKKQLKCDCCEKETTKLQGTWNKNFNKIIYKCENCKNINFKEKT